MRFVESKKQWKFSLADAREEEGIWHSLEPERISQLTYYTDRLMPVCCPQCNSQTNGWSIVMSDRLQCLRKRFRLRAQTEAQSRSPAAAVMSPRGGAPWSNWSPPSGQTRPPLGGPGAGRGSLPRRPGRWQGERQSGWQGVSAKSGLSNEKSDFKSNLLSMLLDKVILFC